MTARPQMTSQRCRQLMDSIDPSRFHEMTEHRGTCNYWSAVVWFALSRARQGGDKLEHEHCEFVVDRAIWAATEIRPHPQFKFLRQRYLSKGVIERFKAALAQGSLTQKELIQGLRHEHVQPRALMAKRIFAASSQEDVFILLNHAEACVVTTAEDAQLSKEGDGWRRYSNAGIQAWDRKMQQFVSLSCDAS